MPGRVNDPRDLESWMVKVDQRLRQLEARRIDAMEGLSQDHATKQISARISEDDGNKAKIGEDGGIFADGTTTTAADNTPAIVLKEMTTGQSIANATDVLVSWQTEVKNVGFTTTATTITIVEAGDYLIAAQWQWANNATGVRGLKITLNSTVVSTGSILSQTFPSVTANEAAHGLTAIIDLAAGDILRCYVFQSSGVALSGGGAYFGDIRGRMQVAKWGDAYAPELTTE